MNEIVDITVKLLETWSQPNTIRCKEDDDLRVLISGQLLDKRMSLRKVTIDSCVVWFQTKNDRFSINLFCIKVTFITAFSSRKDLMS